MKNIKIKDQLELLKTELERVDMTQNRVNEIKKMTLDIAKSLDTQRGVCSIVGLVEDIYREDPVPKYFKRRVKRVVNELLKYVEA